MAKGKRQTAPDPDHKQMPADENIAEGQHMDLDAMDDALDAEGRAGVPAPTGVVLGTSSPNPNLSEEMQGMQLIPKTVGPPQYGSPDPATSASRLMTLEDGHPLEGLPEDHPAAISDDYGIVPEQSSATEQVLTGSEEIDATDDAKELADEHDVNLAGVSGSGKDGRITKADVQQVIDDSETND